MGLCRVYHKPDGTVAVLHPNPKMRAPDESDVEFLDRICARDAPMNGLDGLPFVDYDSGTLPPRSERKVWEVRDGRIATKAPKGTV